MILSSKVFADLHHDESFIRRSLVSTNVNIGLKDTLQATNISSFLFGEKQDEVLKTAKAFENSSKDLRSEIQNQPNKQPKNQKVPPHPHPVSSGGQKQKQQTLKTNQNSNRPHYSTRQSKESNRYQRRHYLQ